MVMNVYGTKEAAKSQRVAMTQQRDPKPKSPLLGNGKAITTIMEDRPTVAFLQLYIWG
jgi:hypothetical protein